MQYTVRQSFKYLRNIEVNASYIVFIHSLKLKGFEEYIGKDFEFDFVKLIGFRYT